MPATMPPPTNSALHQPDPLAPEPLPGGLLLRPARPADLDQIGALLVDRGEPADALDHRLVVTDPDAGWDSCAVVVDGDRVVSTATLLDEELRIGGLTLPAGQVELVATDRAYQGRGLVRALIGWAHQRSAARGHLLQVMIGIPYFYRLFGYEYAIDIPVARPLGPGPAAQPGPAPVFRAARPADLAELTVLQDRAQSGFGVSVPHSPPRRRWLLEHESSTTSVIERDGTVVAVARVLDTPSSLIVAEPAARDAEAARALLDAIQATRPDAALRLVDRPGTVTDTATSDRQLAATGDAGQYYVRIDDLAPALDALRPLLFRRLVEAGQDLTGDDILLSSFRRHYRLAVTDDGLGEVRPGGVLQDPAEQGGAGVAPDQWGALLFGPLGMAGLTLRRPDVYPGPDPELMAALFPPMTADLLTYYLPY